MALVIGNSSYPSGRLGNTLNDARDMRAALKAKGFTVAACCDDAALRDLTNAIDSWTAGLRNGDVAVLYYSGHGIRVGNIDYIVPVDFAAASEADVRYVVYPIERLVDKMEERGTRTSIIILDACRNNPFVISKGSEKGLAGVSAGIGTLIMFAAGEGKTASDNDNGRNSLFTAVLLSELRRSPVDLRTLQFAVRDKVYQLSGKTQIPYSSDGLVGDLVLENLDSAFRLDRSQSNRTARSKGRIMQRQGKYGFRLMQVSFGWRSLTNIAVTSGFIPMGQLSEPPPLAHQKKSKSGSKRHIQFW